MKSAQALMLSLEDFDSPTALGLDLRWKDTIIATDTMAMYTDNLSHERKACGKISANTHELSEETYFFHSQHDPLRRKSCCRTAVHSSKVFLEKLSGHIHYVLSLSVQVKQAREVCRRFLTASPRPVSVPRGSKTVGTAHPEWTDPCLPSFRAV